MTQIAQDQGRNIDKTSFGEMLAIELGALQRQSIADTTGLDPISSSGFLRNGSGEVTFGHARFGEPIPVSLRLQQSADKFHITLTPSGVHASFDRSTPPGEVARAIWPDVQEEIRNQYVRANMVIPNSEGWARLNAQLPKDGSKLFN